MQYYIFKHAVDNYDTGSQFPQIQKMAPGYDYKAVNSVYALSRSNAQFPNYTPNLDYFILHSDAKLTDLLSVAPISGGFMVSNKLRTIFSRFNIIPSKYYAARIKHKNIFYENYFWMHILQSDISNFVGFKNSKFIIYHNYSYNLGSVEVHSMADLIEKKEILKKNNPGKTITIWAEAICLNNDFDDTLDGFEIGKFDSNFYISEKLKNGICDQKITGCDISLANNLYL